MGKKGSKRKTRWRTLSIGAPPGEEDEEDGLRNGYAKSRENDGGVHTFDRNEQTGYKPRRSGTGTSGTSGYGSGGSRSRRDDQTGSPSQPKIIFNEDEYTRITTPRQDVLFKKGYLSRKKPWAGTASTSATPSTTESQSASHSTADGSETTEDQQLLDRDSGTGEYPPVVEPGAQLGYGTLYDHGSGYYYEYPVMLVGPAPIAAQVGPSMLTAVPCGPVPLQTIEWINPAFVPKLSDQPYCVMGYQADQSAESMPVVDEQEGALVSMENTNGTCNESGTGSASCNGSVVGDTEEPAQERSDERLPQQSKEQSEDASPAMEEREEEQQAMEEGEQYAEELPLEHYAEELQVEHYAEELHVEQNGLNGMNGGPYMKPPMLMQPSVHVSHVVPAVPQPYMYPGHYMFGPPLVNVNGVTIQGGPMIRTTNFAAMAAVCAKRKRKKKRRKQRRPALGNTEDDEEEEYSSECDNGLMSSRLPWSVCPTSTTSSAPTTVNRPLNPDCQEFQLRPVVETTASPAPIAASVEAPVSEEASTANALDRNALSSAATDPASREANNESNDSLSSDLTNPENEKTAENDSDRAAESLSRDAAPTVDERGTSEAGDETNRLTHPIAETEGAISTNDDGLTDETKPDIDEAVINSLSANEKRERSTNEVSDAKAVVANVQEKCPEEILTNGNVRSDRRVERPSPSVETTSKPTSIQTPSDEPCCRSSAEKTKSEADEAPRSAAKTTAALPRRKYSAKGSKFVREPTPGPDPEDAANSRTDTEKLRVSETTESSNAEIVSSSKVASATINGSREKHDKTPGEAVLGSGNDYVETKASSDGVAEGSAEDSGFESQTRTSDYPITEAVTEWLRRANSPDIFVTSTMNSGSETEDEDDELDEKPPKNLQSNPMLALSVNSGVDNEPLSRTASCGEFAKANNKIDQVDGDGATGVSRKKKDAKGAKRKSGEKNARPNDSVDGSSSRMTVASADSKKHTSESVPTAGPRRYVGVCEFTEKDSAASVRVATSSRMDSKRVNARRTRKSGKGSKELAENIDVKIRCVGDADASEGTSTDTVSVRTFEKGEIVVSTNGKLLPVSSYEPIIQSSQHSDDAIESPREVDGITEKDGKRSIEDKESNSLITSISSIEEPDVLECWEAETIEPVITPKKMLQSRGISYEGEAAEEDSLEASANNIDLVQKYYRLARESTVSIEEESNEINGNVISSKSTMVPNTSEQMIESFCSEEVPISVSNRKQGDGPDGEKVPIDEAFEVYESCYTGKSPYMSVDPKLFKPRPLFIQEGERPVPCRAVCCNIQ